MADEELKKLLSENLEISRESLKILKGIRRANRMAAAFKIFYWLIIVGSMVGAYFYLQPYLQQALTIVKQVQETISGVQKIGDTVKNGSQISPDILKNIENIMKPR